MALGFRFFTYKILALYRLEFLQSAKQYFNSFSGQMIAYDFVSSIERLSVKKNKVGNRRMEVESLSFTMGKTVAGCFT